MASPLVAGVKRIDSNDDPVDLASWPTARLKVLAHFVQDEVALYGDGFGMAPSDENVGYWLSAMGACKLPMRVEPAQLAAAVEKSLERVDITSVMPWRLFLGDLSAHESRLAMMVLGITSMIVISSADHVLPFPARDGIEYLHLSLSADLQPQLNKAVAFLGRHSPTLVCTEGGHGEGEQGEGAGVAAMVCAAAIAAFCPKMDPDLAIKQVLGRRGMRGIGFKLEMELARYVEGIRMSPPKTPEVTSTPSKRLGAAYPSPSAKHVHQDRAWTTNVPEAPLEKRNLRSAEISGLYDDIEGAAGTSLFGNRSVWSFSRAP